MQGDLLAFNTQLHYALCGFLIWGYGVTSELLHVGKEIPFRSGLVAGECSLPSHFVPLTWGKVHVPTPYERCLQDRQSELIMSIDITPLTEADIPSAIDTIQQAFADDPYNRWVFNDRSKVRLCFFHAHRPHSNPSP